ncbi:Hypothetical predicted protein [Podarcis lilfordi]|uniref:Uncharacterized protein n=1 Tax=Podarcis lilfordi TaxID=74358 RepID=A0AA35K2L4_9SAUR|nr:Hypothetical predicted protein [Podarcis lilfordi]
MAKIFSTAFPYHCYHSCPLPHLCIATQDLSLCRILGAHHHTEVGHKIAAVQFYEGQKQEHRKLKRKLESDHG